VLSLGVFGLWVLSTGAVLPACSGVFGKAANPMPIPAAATTTAAMTIAMSFRKQFFRNISGIYPYQHESDVGTFIDQVILSLFDDRIRSKVHWGNSNLRIRTMIGKTNDSQKRFARVVVLTPSILATKWALLDLLPSK
jgi:hypothetical protein